MGVQVACTKPILASTSRACKLLRDRSKGDSLERMRASMARRPTAGCRVRLAATCSASDSVSAVTSLTTSPAIPRRCMFIAAPS